jgi:two-component system nitrogen regulation response regulator GlnG
VRLALPPLRQRREDVPLLAQKFVADAARRVNAGPKRFLPATLDALRRYDWPGNVRELENLCWRLATLAPGDTLLPSDLPPAMQAYVRSGAISGSTDATNEDWEAALRRWADAALASGANGLHAQASERLQEILFDAALAATGGRRQQAAQRLGLGRNTLTRKLGPGRRK